MTAIKSGDTVRIHYTGTLADGTQFDSSDGREPLEFTAGSGQIIKGLDAAIMGMSEGEAKTVTIPADDAYGHSDPRGIQTVTRSDIPAEIELSIGMQLQARTPNGQVMNLTVTELTDDKVTLDANHALAGKDLTFAFEVVSVN